MPWLANKISVQVGKQNSAAAAFTGKKSPCSYAKN
jgi:hypothetical protein